jgi:ribosomal protein L40E
MSEPKTRRHFLISNRAFSRMTGIKKVCLDCGAADPPRGSVCPGKRPDATEEAER